MTTEQTRMKAKRSRAARKGWRTRRADERSWKRALAERFTHSDWPTMTHPSFGDHNNPLADGGPG